MDETNSLLQSILKTEKAERITYQALFQKYYHFDPINKTNSRDCELNALKQKIENTDTNNLDYDTCLQLLFSQKIEPNLGKGAPTFVYDYPASQAALAKINPDNPLIAERFEVFIDGMEIANGFHELTDATEQLQRFKSDQAQRKKQQKGKQKLAPEIDMRFIDALKHGLPDCAGIAIGLDRLMMCLVKEREIKKVVSFDFERA